MNGRPHLATLVADMARLGKQQAVVEYRGVRRFETSYGELAQGAQWFAAELVRRGVEPGERVVLWAQNSAAWTACFSGCVLRGVLVVPLDAAGGVAFAERVVLETSPRLIVGDQRLLATLGEAVTRETSLAEVCHPQSLGSPGRMDLETIGAAMHARAPKAAEPSQFPDPNLSLDTPLQILFTSGTTGEPKGIVHTHGNLLASLTPIEQEIAKYRRYERWVHPLRILHTLPLSHVFGQFMGLWVAPVLGAVVLYEARLEAPRLLRLLKRERISVLAAVPRVVALLRSELLAGSGTLQAEIALQKQFPIWKRWWHFRAIHRRLGYKFWAIVCGGATLAPELEEFWTTLGFALIQGYGMTETSALVTLNHPFKPARGTLGTALPGRELQVTESGELLVRGPMVASQTWRGGKLQAAEGDGWLATGDLARRDADGRLHYLGRTGQRLVTSAGLNVYLEDVEAALLAEAGVRGAVALAVEGVQGPEPGAVLLMEDALQTTAVVARANGFLAPHQRVGHWWVWPELDLPRTATGKVRRHQVEAWVRERVARQEQAVEASRERSSNRSGELQDGEDSLLQLLERATGTALRLVAESAPKMRDHLRLDALGVDSLGWVQLQAALEAAGGRTIDDRTIAAIETVGDLRRVAGLPGCTSAPLSSAYPVAGEARSAEREESSSSSSHPGNSESMAPPVHTPDPPAAQPFSVPQSVNAAEARAAAVPPMARTSPKALSRAAATPAFLYLRWTWARPVQWLRVAFLEACMRPLVWLLAGPRVVFESRARAASQPPLLIVANHLTAYDLPLLLYALPPALRRRVATAAAGEMLEDWRHGVSNPAGPLIYWLLTVLFNLFPLPRNHGFRSAFDHAGAALDRGYSVLIFPEGRRSKAGLLQPFQGGIGLLAQQAAVPVLPVALIESRRSGRGLRPFAATVRVGELLILEGAESAQSITGRLEQAVRALLAPATE